MPQDPAPMDQLRDEPLRFLETEQFQEMLSVYRKLKPLEQENPRKFRNQLNTYDFSDIYPIMDTYLQTRALSDPEAVSAVIAEGAPESVAFASTLLDIFETTVAERVQEYDVLGNSPATYFICGVWANMKRGREFHPASNGITVTYDQPDAYGNQNIRYRNKDYEMTLIFEAVEAYTKNLSWTAHRLLIYTLMRGNADNWRNNTATFSIEEYMAWAGLKSRDAAYRQLKKDMQAITGMKITAESFKKYFEPLFFHRGAQKFVAHGRKRFHKHRVFLPVRARLQYSVFQLQRLRKPLAAQRAAKIFHFNYFFHLFPRVRRHALPCFKSAFCLSGSPFFTA